MNPHNTRPRQWAPILALALVSLPFLCCACGGDGRPKRYPATGKVLVDGKGEAGIKVRFDPAERLRDLDALHPSGVTNAEGIYTLGSYEEGDGALPGKYKVTLFWPDSPSEKSRPNDLFHGKYNNPESSEFERTISEGENHLETIDAKKGTPTPRTRQAARKSSVNGPDARADGDAPASR